MRSEYQILATLSPRRPPGPSTSSWPDNPTPPTDEQIAGQERYAALVRLAEQIQHDRAADFPVYGYPWQEALADAATRLRRREEQIDG